MMLHELLLLPQRQEFSSKSQRQKKDYGSRFGCCCYHKGRNFQANHNSCNAFFFAASLLLLPQRQEFSSKSQRARPDLQGSPGCCCYHKGRNFQANHNQYIVGYYVSVVVVATTKVGIFKQITTKVGDFDINKKLLLLPQRQEFSSKSQQLGKLKALATRCCCYHKGRNFQANHNLYRVFRYSTLVVVATTKVGIFKQITTHIRLIDFPSTLLLLPQRQEFSSKSQLPLSLQVQKAVVVATTKVGIFKQITTSSSAIE